SSDLATAGPSATAAPLATAAPATAAGPSETERQPEPKAASSAGTDAPAGTDGAAANAADPLRPAAGDAELAPAGSVPASAAEGPAVAAKNSAGQGTPDSAGLRRLWPEVLDQVRARSRRTRALLDNASVAAVDGTVIRLAASSAPIAKMIADDRNLTVLREALTAVVGGGWTVEVGADGGQPVAGPPGPAPAGSSSGSPAPATPSAPPPVDEADEVDEETDAVSEAGLAGGDAEAVAIALLQNGLGARPIERS
ncbi:MAG: hypothetical protein ACJ74U_15940, partial [Jatrophihabitantaceae bacterium]